MADGNIHDGSMSCGRVDVHSFAVLRRRPTFDGLQFLHLLQHPHLYPCRGRSRHARLRRRFLPRTVEMELVQQAIGYPNRIRQFRRCQQGAPGKLLASLPSTGSVREPPLLSRIH